MDVGRGGLRRPGQQATSSIAILSAGSFAWVFVRAVDRQQLMGERRGMLHRRVCGSRGVSAGRCVGLYNSGTVCRGVAGRIMLTDHSSTGPTVCLSVSV